MKGHREIQMASARAVSAVALAATVVLAPAPARAGEDRVPGASVDLSGVWVLDREKSDDAREKMREAMGGPGGRSGPGGPGGRRPGSGGGAPGAGGGPPPGAVGGQDPREAMKALFEPAEEITITQTPREIEVDETFGELRRFRPNGRTYKTDNGLSETKAEWKDGVLHVETKGGPGAKRVETWELSPDGRRLTVRVEVEGGRMPDLTLTRVYNRSEDEPPGTDRP
jgi:hypothetical protein